MTKIPYAYATEAYVKEAVRDLMQDPEWLKVLENGPLSMALPEESSQSFLCPHCKQPNLRGNPQSIEPRLSV